MPNYCVNTNAQANGDHEVHDVTPGVCGHLPLPHHRMDEARQAVVREWSSWLRANPTEAPSGTDALVFFQHLRNERTDLLMFKASGDKWQVVHSWLLRARLVRD